MSPIIFSFFFSMLVVVDLPSLVNALGDTRSREI